MRSTPRHSPLRQAGRALLDVLFPPLCKLCGEWIEADRREFVCVCPRCWDSIEAVAPPWCLRCGTVVAPEKAHLFVAANATERAQLRAFDEPPVAADAAGRSVDIPSAICRPCREETPPFAVCRAAGRYEGPLEEVVKILKFQPRPSLARPLGAWLRAFAAQRPAFFPGDPVLVPVPIHPARRRERGFNQSELLADELSRVRLRPGPLEVRPRALARLRMTRSQTGLAWRERLANVEGAFGPGREAQAVAGRPVVLVDDVVTTTATASACAAALLWQGASTVRVLALARGVLGR